MKPDYGREREPELDPVRDLGRLVRFFHADGTHEDLTPEEARVVDLESYPEPIDYDYLCGHTVPIFPPTSPPRGCPYCRHGIDAPGS